MTALRVLLVEDEALVGLLPSEVLDGIGHVICAIKSIALLGTAVRWGMQ